MKKGLRRIVAPYTLNVTNTVPNLDLMKKGLRQIANMISGVQVFVPNLDLMKKGLRLISLLPQLGHLFLIVPNLDLMKKGLRLYGP